MCVAGAGAGDCFRLNVGKDPATEAGAFELPLLIPWGINPELSAAGAGAAFGAPPATE